MLRTSSFTINIGDFALNNGGVEETLVSNSQSSFRFVLISFSGPFGSADSFESGSRHGIIQNANTGDTLKHIT
jgi:hypothetical protein